MKRLLTLLCLLGCLAAGAREKVQRNLIRNRYSFEDVKAALVMNQKWVPYPAYADRAGWDLLTGPFKADLVRNGEKYLNYEWKVIKATDYLEYEKSGNRTVMENPLGRNNTAIAALFAAELAEGKGRFIPQIVNGVFHACEMTSWALSAHLASLSHSRRSLPEKGDNTLELTQGGMAQLFSWIYYYLRPEMDKLQPEIGKRLKAELTCRELDAYLTRDDFWWMGLKDNRMLNNWTPWCSSNAILCFMLMEDDKDRLAQAVWKSICSVDEYLNYVQGDGGIEEGPSYWGHAPGKLYDYLNALSMITAGKVNIFDELQVRMMGEYIVRSYVGNGWVVNFADASARGGADALDLIFRYGKAVGSELMAGYAENRAQEHPFHPSPSLDASRFLESLRYADAFKQARDPYIPAPYTWYPETEFHYMSNADGIFVAARGGNNDESHNHNDIGSFNLYYDSLPVILDVGVGTYTKQTFSSERYSIWTMQSNYHNLPLINGTPQRNGRQYKAKNCRSTPASFSVDIAGAYPEEACVQKWIRSYSLAGKVLKIRDSFSLREAKEPNRLHFMTWGTVTLPEKGIVRTEVGGKQYELRYDSKTFDASVESIELTDKRLSDVWGSTLYRIVLKARKAPKSGRYDYSFVRLQ